MKEWGKQLELKGANLSGPLLATKKKKMLTKRYPPRTINIAKDWNCVIKCYSCYRVMKLSLCDVDIGAEGSGLARGQCCESIIKVFCQKICQCLHQSHWSHFFLYFYIIQSADKFIPTKNIGISGCVVEEISCLWDVQGKFGLA